jgi:predicted PolB exonuclease-like 3'-5' exonuclease
MSTAGPLRPQAPILVFDIETVPDIVLALDNYEPKLEFEVNPETAWRDLRIMEAISTQKKVSFPPTIFHIPISICAVFVHPETFCLMDGFKKTLPTPNSRQDLLAGERQLLKSFWEFAIKYKDLNRPWYDKMESDLKLTDYQRKQLKPFPVTFCGYNIGGFDLPVIEQRSIRHLVSCPIPEYALKEGTDSYRYKYALDRVFDLAAFFSNHQQQCRTNLDNLARSLGLAGKMEGMHGSKVAEEYFQNNQWERIEEYCAVDVLITYGVFLSIQKFRGAIDASLFKECVEHFKRFLTQEGKPPTYRALAEGSPEFFDLVHRADL